MTLFSLAIVVHVLGVILWVGGVLAGGLLIRLRLDGDPSGKLAEGENRVFKSLAGHGMMLTVLAGAALIALRGGLYLHQGWFIAKLILVAALIGLHMTLRVRGKRLAAAPESVTGGTLCGLQAAISLVAAAILLLVFTQPF